ncbi:MULTISPECIES: DUF3301 domain-containing protein [Oceanimonas]|uniref:DUF3301 domain-containing protein n=1 Tax=Oceanimonas doudoroffii TaxID=84158 RepID=A0A233RI83_9GAMM|nr:DUF3301 domain-containing protein [Oceanimonas doudoroffii]NHI00301.1 hypothetical protein [Oceanimonas sp. MB9]OXY83103.1 hypothetical protein B6S08_06290 [Oceanimonas doudoroffii]
MAELLGLLALFLLGAGVWQLRRQSEFAGRWLQHYCKRQQFQLLSIYRYRFCWRKGRLLAHFRFEFSHDGVQHNEGELWLAGLRVVEVSVPVLREPPGPFEEL